MNEHSKAQVVTHVIYLAIISLLILLIVSTGLLRYTKNNALRQIGFSPSKSDVRLAFGEPSRIVSPGKQLLTGGAFPSPPPPDPSQEVWVYSRMMKLTFVYFGPDGRAQMVFYATT